MTHPLRHLIEPAAAIAALTLCVALAQLALPPSLEPQLSQAVAGLGQPALAPPAPLVIDEDVETFGPAVLLRYLDGPIPARRYHIWQRAVRRAADRTSEPFDVHVAWWLGAATNLPAAHEPLTSQLRVERAEVSLRSGSRALPAADLIDHLEDALRGRLVASSHEPAGRHVRLRLANASDDQHLDALVALMEDSHTLLQPRFLRGAVNPGESWSYTLPLDGPGPERPTYVDGDAHVTCTFEGMVQRGGKRYALLRQRWTLRGEGAARLQSVTAPLRLTGQGSGVVLFDPAAGSLIAADLYITQTLTVGDAGRVVDRDTQLSLSLRSEGAL
jgi:hypothetical protein